ncbi:MAG TPA: lipid-A-disaccharide synthase [Terrimicrobiaceae bacterium]
MRSLWFVAGEASGDARAAEVMNVLRSLEPNLRFLGAGGPKMQALATGRFDNWIAEAGVLGLWDVIKNYRYFRRKFSRMLAEIEAVKPTGIVLVDYPGFNLRLAKALRRRGYPGKILYYISPQVWAWNRARIPRMAQLLDLMICLFPFEKPMYEASGLHTVFTGHPLLESLAKERTATDRNENLLGLFPGSREREVKRIFPSLLGACRLIQNQRPDVCFEVAAASDAHAIRMREMAGDFPITVRSGNAHSLMQRACVGIVCSGTATLEAAFFGLPYCLVYRVAWLTYEVGRRLVDVDCLGIINILNNYKQNPPTDPRLPAKPAPHLVREFVQHSATPAALSAEALRLLNHPTARSDLITSLDKIVSTLQGEGAACRASQALLEAL